MLPARAPEAEAARLVSQHAAWIARHTARVEARRRALAVRPSLAFGRPLVIGGETQVVRATSAAEVAALERRLRRLARSAIKSRLAERSAEMGIPFARVAIRDQRSRWGSASRAGTLSFSWRLILCPPSVLDYVVVHELAHLRVAGHGRRFWALVERHYGSTAEARKWLRENQDSVRHALD